MGESLEIQDVTPEAMAQLGRFLGRDRLKGFEGNAGTVTGDCIEVGFEFDPDAGLLEVTPERLPDHLQADGALREMLDIALLAESEEEEYPSHCGIYTYGLFQIVNNSGLGLTYASNDLEHGTVEVNAQQIEPGASPRAFTAESAKGSTVGISGTVVYGLDDGVTSMNIQYYMVVAASASCTVGLSGANASRYKVTIEHPDGETHGYTYMKPELTINPAK